MTSPSPFPRDDLLTLASDMEAIATEFYWRCFNANMATRCHAFLEFAALMTEFVNVCRDNVELGRDYTHANTHSDQGLTLHQHRAKYLASKLDCIFGPIFRQDPDARRMLVRALAGEKGNAPPGY